MTIWRSYAELNNGEKIVELLWDDRDEALKYFKGLRDYSRCNRVEIWELRSTPDHVFKDVDCLAEFMEEQR